jgi:ABC-type uncharacterized transport system YnjBCD ATPase subunit
MSSSREEFATGRELANGEVDFAALAALIARRTGDRGRILVGIDGPGASGKSTFSSLLARQLADACVVQVDDFYLPSSERESRRGEVGALFDLPRLHEQVVSPARSGAALQWPALERRAGKVHPCSQ